MKRMALMGLVVGLGLTGCRALANQAPYAGVPLEELKTKGTYDVLQTAEGSSSGAVLLGIFPIGLEDKRGQEAFPDKRDGGAGFLGIPPIFSFLGDIFPDAEGRVRSAALYNAIEAQPGADALLSPRFNTDTTNYFFIYKEVSAKCRGKAIRYNPTTNQ